MASRFDYVKYDEKAQIDQTLIKKAFEKAEALIEELPEGRAKALSLTYLEIAYMWTGKAIRDEQIKRDPAGSNDVPERSVS